MTLTSHISEILRQGIWASLTGGWYYEPTHSIFCNTVHLYLWLVLLLTPFIIGLVSSGVFATSIFVAYTLFIALLFTVLKVIVSYFHIVFDTTEPLVTTQQETTENIAERDEAPTVERANDRDIEMREIRRPERSDISHRSRFSDIVNARQAARRRVRIEFEPLNDNVPSLDVDDVEVEFHQRENLGARVSNEHRIRVEKALEAVDREKDSEIIGDILEPLPSTSKVSDITESEFETPVTDSVQSTKHGIDVSLFNRKMSEPLLSLDSDGWMPRRRRSSDGTESRVRRANSSFEARHQGREKGILSQTSLVTARENTNKSYPSKISSEEEFYTRKLLRKPGLATSSSLNENDNGSVSDAQCSQTTWKDSSPHLSKSTEENSRPQCSQAQALPARPGTPIEPMFILGRDEMMDVPSTSSAWMPVVVSLDRPSTSSVNEDRPGTSTEGSGDIKGEITKFLEDLIDKHPETLDAIETVRMSRMGKTKGGYSSILKSQSGRRKSGSSSTAVSALSDLMTRDGTHVATGHEDTTQGAVHSFQDEDGNWWTYAFDDKGVGTAQPLGSDSAVLDILNRERAAEQISARTILDVLPESTYASSEDDDEFSKRPGPSGVPMGPVVQTTRRERALSSSSNESYTYIPSVPTSVLHASTSHNNNNSGPQLSFVNVASRLRSVIRQSSEDRQRLEQVLNLLDHPVLGPRRSENALQELIMRQESREYPRRPSVKKNYYYQMKMFPRTNKSLKLKIDRLAVLALLDRNKSVFSCIFDVFLASLVSILACLVLSTGIYYEINMLMFAFVVAGAHFSLLKSVQPDAASPIHGFNWLVAYSRPVYFCILSSLLLLINQYTNDPHLQKIPWNWNPYRLHDTSSEMILMAIRDLLSTLILFLPLSFTLGWLPQVNTLVHHVLEQTEMHIFGGTASLGALSAGIQISKSIISWLVLVGVCHVAFWMDPKTTQTLSFAAFCAVTVGISYFLSRFSSNHQLTIMIWKSLYNSCCNLLKSCKRQNNNTDNSSEEESEAAIFDPLPGDFREIVVLRAKHDILYGLFLALGVFALHCTSVFTVTRPIFQYIIVLCCCIVSGYNHYLYIQLRTHTPWKLIAKPFLRSAEFDVFESNTECHLMIFERIAVWLQAIERNILYPLLVISLLSDGIWDLPFARWLGPLVALRLLRGGFCQPKLLYIPLLLAFLFTHYDFASHIEIISQGSTSAWMMFIFYFIVVIYPKWLELYLKVNFIMAYVAPWQISWGSAFHAFAQPFSVPHAALIWAQTVLSSIISAPLNPLLGSSFFILSYVRPVKFWERDYNTRRTDASNTRLASQIDRGPMLDDSNLNAVFYEHLTRSLQKSLAGDLLMGRWASSVEPGDCFILASFYLNCLVHVIEVGNGFVTFQLRGLEFRGTYCHQREVEAISEDQTEGTGFCCCSPGSLPGFLSLNTTWGLRWLAWEVVSGKYIVDGYSITDNSAVNLLQVHELRRLLISLYIKCIIYYATRSQKVVNWIWNETICEQLDTIISNRNYVDMDHMFCPTNDDDFDSSTSGISRNSFWDCYAEWVYHCLQQRYPTNPSESSSDIRLDNRVRDRIVHFCYMLSLVGRRALGAASHNRHSTAAESFLYGLHALFKGDFRIQCERDEWVFADVDILRVVMSPAVKMALKLHQDHFAASDDFDDHEALYELIGTHESNLFISHEHDPAWRRAILANTNSLLALRHVYDDGADDYKIIMLNKMYLNMRVIKLNRECVRSFWAGQQQELIFLRNRNPERGSIQNARQVLRNMINSSADQPVGYPIFVSPLTTSFVDTHPQMKRIVGPTITLDTAANLAVRGWRFLRRHLGPSTSSSLGQSGCGGGAQSSATSNIREQEADDSVSHSSAIMDSLVHLTPSGARVSLARRGVDVPSNVLPIIPSTSSAAPKPILITRQDLTPGEENVPEVIDHPVWVEITNPDMILKNLCEPLRSSGQFLVEWPNEELRILVQKNVNRNVAKGHRGQILHSWFPNDPNKSLRSHIGNIIHVVMIHDTEDWPIVIIETGCKKVEFEKTIDENDDDIPSQCSNSSSE